MTPRPWSVPAKHWHPVAELLLAGPAYASDADIRLRATSGRFGVWRQPGPRVDGIDLVIGDRRIPLVGMIASVAETAGLVPRTLADVDADVVSTPVDAPLPISAEVNYGVAPGDSFIATPCAYVAPGRCRPRPFGPSRSARRGHCPS